ncbi:MAG: 2-phosphosulfolactate phosphatase [Deltaproteobacteria bacterium]|nr:2-phosphosulfolactate phosphatase [Deltaproteobacteria bacterium]
MPPEVHLVTDHHALEELRGVVVILDIFRAGHTILALLGAGAGAVIPLADLDQARELKLQNPGWLLLGERGGVPPAGFDGDNSPAWAASQELSGRTAILTTSAGTQAVHRLAAAEHVLFGSFAGAGALVTAVQRLAPRQVHLLPMGEAAKAPAFEDDAAAAYLAAALTGAPPEFQLLRPLLLDCPGAARLKRLGQDADLAFCTTLNSHNLVPRVDYRATPPRVRTL